MRRLRTHNTYPYSDELSGATEPGAWAEVLAVLRG